MIDKRLRALDYALFVEAAEFFKSALSIQNAAIPLTVRIVDNIGKGDVAGVCTAFVESDNSISKIVIDIKSSVTVFGMVEALAHEMCHAEQFITGKLNFYKEKQFIFGIFPFWQRRRRWKSSSINMSGYYDNPAEIEAFIKQRAYALEFFKSVEDRLMPKMVFDHIMHERQDVVTFISQLEMSEEPEQI